MRASPSRRDAPRSVALRIDGLSAGGEGVGSLPEGKRIFVPFTAPGDAIVAEVVEERRRFARGRLAELREAGAGRVAPPCPHFGGCGGCQLQHLAEDVQAEAKERAFYEALARIGKVDRAAIGEARPLRSVGTGFAYRIRCRLHVRGDRLGYLRQGSHRLEAIETCALLAPALQRHVDAVRRWIGSRPQPWLSAVELCVGAEGEGAAALLPREGAPADWAEGAEELLTLGLVGVRVDPWGARRDFGAPVVSWPAPLAPQASLYLRPELFAQAHAEGNRILVEEAVSAVLGDRSTAEVLELCAGAGNFSFALASGGARVTAVEVEGGALELAQRSAKEAKDELAGRLRFVAGDAAEVVSRFAGQAERQPFDTVLLDPPRTGAKELMPELLRLRPARIVYVSCDPATLARDLGVLVEGGYRITRAEPFDLFPQTRHVEAIVTLEAPWKRAS